jgi:hypothetical protein
MHKHLVLWKLKPQANERKKEENGLRVKEKIEGLKNTIPEINFLDVGINIGGYGASFYDVGMYITFKNEDAFLKYITYKCNDEAVTFIQSVMEAEEIVDFT